MLNWKGDELKEKMNRVIPWAINSITSECVREAKSTVPKVTTVLQGSIQMRPAKKYGNVWAGLWGSFNCLYAIFVELGTKPHDIFPRTKKALFWEGADHPVTHVSHPGTKAKPFLRPAADKLYPLLAEKIKEGMRAT